jgi:hypothetical protein
MTDHLSRRDFLKLSAAALSGLALMPYSLRQQSSAPALITSPFPYSSEIEHGTLLRIATREIDLRIEPRDTASIIGKRYRDQIVHVYDEVIPDDAPAFYNRLWYKVWGGYIHSSHTQIVSIRHNEVESSVPEAGRLVEVTVPYTEAWQFNSLTETWKRWNGARLYYSSTHWITGKMIGPDGEPWYQITNELSKTLSYYAPARHFRVIPESEMTPLATDVPPEKKRIEISLAEQMLRAFEEDREVYSARISSGIYSTRLAEGDFPTVTPKGRFNIYSKMPSKHMGSIAGGPEVEASGGFSLPGVPWTSFFKFEGGYALHGTYWHNNYGIQMSHGCVNMRNDDARWIFRWTTPVFETTAQSQRDWEKRGNGTRVIIS